MDAVARIAGRDPTLPIVVLTGLDDEHFGVTAVASGAQDYLVKGHVEPDTLHRSLLYAIERKRSERPPSTSTPAGCAQRTPDSNARYCPPLLDADPGADRHPVPAEPGERAARR